jgi:hypothetical protein
MRYARSTTRSSLPWRPALGALLYGGAFAAGAAASPAAPFRLPAPSGPHAVATTSWHLIDEDRTETLGAAGPRQVEVLAWYPTAWPPRGERAPYLRGGATEIEAFAAQLSAGAAAALTAARAHAVLDAEPLEAAGRLPVLLFSAGYLGLPSSHTALLEDLASYGYAVLQVVHPYEVAAATLADGRTASMLGADGVPLAPVRAVLAEWQREDEIVAAAVAAADEPERLRQLRAYLDGLAQTRVALRRWVDDARLVLDRLDRLPRESAGGRLAARLDARRLGAFGHSFGGVAAGELCLEERGCRAVLNLDGVPQYGSMIERRLGKPLLMVHSSRPGRVGGSDPIYRRSASEYLRADVRDALHLDFTELPAWGGPWRERGLAGAIPSGRAIEIVRTLAREFFDQELLDRRSALLAGDRSEPGLTVTRVR